MSATIDINGKKLLPIKEVISKVDYSRDYVTRLAREKKIVATQIGRHWYIDLDSLQNYQTFAVAEQEIKKRQLSEERKRDLAIKQEKAQKQKAARQRVRRKLPAVMSMCLIVAIGVGVGVLLESQLRTNFAGITQLANLKTVLMDEAQPNGRNVQDFVSENSDGVSPMFTPTVSYRDLTSGEGLLLVPAYASSSAEVQAYFSDPVMVVEDEDGYDTVRRLDTKGNPTGAEIPFVIVPINTASP